MSRIALVNNAERRPKHPAIIQKGAILDHLSLEYARSEICWRIA